MTYEEMIDLLSSSPEIDLSEFGQPGKKSLDDLYAEITGRDVTLRGRADGRVYRVAMSVKVIVYGGIHELQILRETKRVFDDGTIVEKLQPWGVSETRKIGETPLQAAERGIIEELDISRDVIEKIQQVSASDEIDEHPSTVYPGVWSTVFFRYCSWFMPPQFFNEGGHISRDGPMTIHRQWFADTLQDP